MQCSGNMKLSSVHRRMVASSQNRRIRLICTCGVAAAAPFFSMVEASITEQSLGDPKTSFSKSGRFSGFGHHHSRSLLTADSPRRSTSPRRVVSSTDPSGFLGDDAPPAPRLIFHIYPNDYNDHSPDLTAAAAYERGAVNKTGTDPEAVPAKSKLETAEHDTDALVESPTVVAAPVLSYRKERNPEIIAHVEIFLPAPESGGMPSVFVIDNDTPSNGANGKVATAVPLSPANEVRRNEASSYKEPRINRLRSASNHAVAANPTDSQQPSSAKREIFATPVIQNPKLVANIAADLSTFSATDDFETDNSYLKDRPYLPAGLIMPESSVSFLSDNTLISDSWSDDSNWLSQNSYGPLGEAFTHESIWEDSVDDMLDEGTDTNYSSSIQLEVIVNPGINQSVEVLANVVAPTTATTIYAPATITVPATDNAIPNERFNNRSNEFPFIDDESETSSIFETATVGFEAAVLEAAAVEADRLEDVVLGIAVFEGTDSTQPSELSFEPAEIISGETLAAEVAAGLMTAAAIEALEDQDPVTRTIKYQEYSVRLPATPHCLPPNAIHAKTHESGLVLRDGASAHMFYDPSLDLCVSLDKSDTLLPTFDHCPVGSLPEGQWCVGEIQVPPILTCPTNYMLHSPSARCIRLVVFDPPQTPQNTCPDGFKLKSGGSGIHDPKFCHKLERVSPFLGGPSPGTFSTSSESDSIAELYCPEGYFLHMPISRKPECQREVLFPANAPLKKACPNNAQYSAAFDGHCVRAEVREPEISCPKKTRETWVSTAHHHVPKFQMKELRISKTDNFRSPLRQLRPLRNGKKSARNRAGGDGVSYAESAFIETEEIIDLPTPDMPAERGRNLVCVASRGLASNPMCPSEYELIHSEGHSICIRRVLSPPYWDCRTLEGFRFIPYASLPGGFCEMKLDPSAAQQLATGPSHISQREKKDSETLRKRTTAWDVERGLPSRKDPARFQGEPGRVWSGASPTAFNFVAPYIEPVGGGNTARNRTLATMALNLTQKIIAAQSTSSCLDLTPGALTIVRVARTLASEITLVGIRACLENINPSILAEKFLANPAGFYLACDHSVDPRNYDDEEIKRRIKMCQDTAVQFGLKDYGGPNETIVHTEFYKKKAVPGTVIVGADSHSCSHGCVGALAMGMGASDTALAILTGLTWLAVPEVVLVRIEGELRPGLCGKDAVLWLLKKYGRNTVALDRVVEFGGDISSLDIDSRFALSNMATEFGAIAGIFPADEITMGFLRNRKNQSLKKTDLNYDDDESHEQPIILRADKDAKYAAEISLNLSEVEFTVAKWPSPDNVYTLDDADLYTPLQTTTSSGEALPAFKDLDGCFIGACTTTENEMILAGLLLDVMMNRFNFRPATRASPAKQYRRRLTPGSVQISKRLETLGLLDVYRKAGFEIGTPSCSYCLGIGADVAGSGEVWLSSQNRNFQNRMGPGALGSITSASVVAASSFKMQITDPEPYVRHIDFELYKRLIALPNAVR